MEQNTNSVIVSVRNNCIGVLPFCGQHPVDPAQLSSLGLPQLTEVIFTCVECGIRAGVGWHCDSVSV